MKHITEETTISAMVQVWALPKREYRDEGWAFTGEFEYVVRDTGNKPYIKGAIMLTEMEVEVVIPAGINMLNATVETIKRQIDKVRAEAFEEVSKLQDDVNELLMLTYQPE